MLIITTRTCHCVPDSMAKRQNNEQTKSKMTIPSAGRTAKYLKLLNITGRNIKCYFEKYW